MEVEISPEQAEKNAKRRKHSGFKPKPDDWLAKKKITELVNVVDLWEEFVNRREHLKDQGLAADQAWQAAWIEVKPLYDERVFRLAHKSIADTIQPASPAKVFDKALFGEDEQRPTAINFRSDIEWVYKHLGKDILPTEAPNSGAWWLLQWARDNAREFFMGLFSKVLPSRGQLDEEQTKVDDGGVIRLLDEVEAVSKGVAA